MRCPYYIHEIKLSTTLNLGEECYTTQGNTLSRIHRASSLDPRLSCASISAASSRVYAELVENYPEGSTIQTPQTVQLAILKYI